MPSQQSKIRNLVSLIDEDWFRSNMGGAKTSSEGVRNKWRASGGNTSPSRSSGRISSLGKRYAVVRVGKIKGMSKLSAAASHNSRDRETLNADPDRLDDNQMLWGVEGSKDVLDAWQSRAPDKVRSNAVHALEYVISASPAALAEMNRDEQDQYFADSLRFLATKHGSENILSAVVHRDEQTPHLQALVIPLDENERLNARAHVGGRDKLRELQSDFADLVAEPYGLERGRERSVARHRTIKEYYAEAHKKPDISPERLKEAIPERETGSMLKRKESDEAYAARVADAMMEVTANNLGALQKRINELEAENLQLEADRDAGFYLANTMNQAAMVAASPERDREFSNWQKAHEMASDPKIAPSNQEKIMKTLDRIADKHGFSLPDPEPKRETPQRLMPKRQRPTHQKPSREDDYDR